MTPPLRKPKECNVRIKLTKKQREQLQPLIEQAKQNPGTGFVLGQNYRNIEVNFQFVTADELQERLGEARRLQCAPDS